MNIALTDKIIMPHLADKYYIDVSNESEAIAIAAGHYLATGERANVYMSADGFMNALNFFTSWIMVEPIEMNITISTGREEAPHKITTRILEQLLELLEYDTKRIFIKLVRRQS